MRQPILPAMEVLPVRAASQGGCSCWDISTGSMLVGVFRRIEIAKYPGSSGRALVNPIQARDGSQRGRQ